MGMVTQIQSTPGKSNRQRTRWGQFGAKGAVKARALGSPAGRVVEDVRHAAIQVAERTDALAEVQVLRATAEALQQRERGAGQLRRVQPHRRRALAHPLCEGMRRGAFELRCRLKLLSADLRAALNPIDASGTFTRWVVAWRPHWARRGIDSVESAELETWRRRRTEEQSWPSAGLI